MKILLLANHCNTGGITTYLMTLSRFFLQKGHTVIMATSGGDMSREIEDSGARHLIFPFNVKCEVHPRLFFMTARLSKVVREERVDIIHAQTRVTQMSAELVSKVTGVPYVSTCHGFFRPHLGRRLLPLWGRKVIAISSQVKDHLLRDFNLRLEQIAHIPNGIDLARFAIPSEVVRLELREKWGNKNQPTVGIVARLSDVKGHKFLIEAMPMVLKNVPAAKCFIFGEGPLKSELQALVAAKGLRTKVFFFPVINRASEVLPLLDVFVMPSIQEGLGLSVLEAAAMGLPSVVSWVGGLPEVVLNEETGFLVPSRDPAALARAIILLLGNIPLARVMGKKAFDFVSGNFSAEPMAEATLAVYKDVIEGRL